MKFHHKIKQIRLNLNLSQKDVQKRSKEIFTKDKAISQATLSRIEDGAMLNSSRIFQLCAIYGINITDLLKDTEFDELMLIRHKERFDKFTYDTSASASVINAPNQKSLKQEYLLQPGGKTVLEQSPPFSDPIPKDTFTQMGFNTETLIPLLVEAKYLTKTLRVPNNFSHLSAEFKKSLIILKPQQIFCLEFLLRQTKTKFEKFVYVAQGKLVCVIDNIEYDLERKDTISFDSSLPHYFHNKESKKCVFLLDMNPKYL